MHKGPTSFHREDIMKLFKLITIVLFCLLAIYIFPAGSVFAEEVEMVVELRDGIYGTTPSSLYAYDDSLFFTGYNTDAQQSLYKWDGNSAVIVGGSTGAGISNLASHNGSLYMEANSQLYQYDEVSVQIAQAPNSEHSYGGGSPSYLGSVGDKLYYVMQTSSHGKELYSYNSADGVQIVSDIVPGSGSSHTQDVAASDSGVYFTACDVGDGSNYELWYADNSTGQVSKTELNPGGKSSPSNKLILNDGRLVMTAEIDSANIGQEAYIYDPVSGQISLMGDVLDGSADSYPSNFVEMGDVVYFKANSSWYGEYAAGKELFSWDDENGLQLAADINPGSANSMGWGNMAQYGNAIYFAAEDGSGEQEVWKYDPVNGAQQVTDINTSGDSSPNYFTVADNVLYFSANDGVTGKELWKITAEPKWVELYLNWMGMPYTQDDQGAILDILLNQSGSYSYGEGAISYITDALLPGDDGSREIGDYWEYAGKKYLKTGSGIVYAPSGGEEPAAPELPMGMAQMMVLGLGGLLARFRRRA
ncbi:MAG: hypothetical protein GF392_06105 [Candidatus Omnitrophica bacterium]|nr:hypothetical protein [Candidatus Omnitrophota bacterium]